MRSENLANNVDTCFPAVANICVHRMNIPAFKFIINLFLFDGNNLRSKLFDHFLESLETKLTRFQLKCTKFLINSYHMHTLPHPKQICILTSRCHRKYRNTKCFPSMSLSLCLFQSSQAKSLSKLFMNTNIVNANLSEMSISNCFYLSNNCVQWLKIIIIIITYCSLLCNFDHNGFPTKKSPQFIAYL
jgi:hypothetical protein